MLVDLHAKSSLSEGTSLTIQQTLERARDAGIGGVAFTETLSTAHCMHAIAAGEQLGVKVFIGVEIPTDRGLLLCFTPEVDDFYLAEHWRRYTDLTVPDASTIIDLFTSRGGAVIAARPYDLEIPYNMGDQVFNLDDLDGVEVFNTRVGELQNDFALEASRFLGVATTGGSDAREDINQVGQYATFFLTDLETQADLVAALRSSQHWGVQLGESRRATTSRAEEPNRKRDSDRGGRGGRGGDRGDRGDRGGRGGDRGGRGGDRGGRGGDRGGRGGRGGDRSRDRGGRNKNRGGRDNRRDNR